MKSIRPIQFTTLMVALAAAAPVVRPSRAFAAPPATKPPPVKPAVKARDKPAQMTFRNNLQRGYLTRHLITRSVQRVMKKSDHEETLVWEQKGRLVQCNIENQQGGAMMAYQMFADGPARVVEVLRDGKRVSPTPGGASFNLPLSSTRLHSTTVTGRDAPAFAPLADPVQKLLLHLVMDHAHWPVEKIDAGHRWKTAVRRDGFDGRQSMQFVDLVSIKGKVAGRVTMYVKGKFTNELARDYDFDKIQAVVYWSRLDRALLKLEAQAFYSRRRATATDKYVLKVRAHLIERRLLDDDEQELVKVQLTAFAEALDDFNAGRTLEAARKCRGFQETWPDAIWLPAVAELARQASPEERGGRRSPGEVKELLARGVITWEAARETDEPDLVEKSERLFAELVEKDRDTIVRLARDKDEHVRALAVFALSFSPRAADADTVESALRDKDANVRSLALAGLAACRGSAVAGRSERVSVKALSKLLGDESTGVRRRACQAVAACVPRESTEIVSIIDDVVRLMIHDEADMVRREAVRTLAVIGASADVTKLEKALHHEMNQGIRREIERAMETLRNRE